MKGEALITIKDKNGNIKKQVKETNVVFDIPKELTKDIIGSIDVGGGTDSSSEYNVITFLTKYADWFGSIKINDEVCSETDFKDWKMPVLYGGEIAKTDNNNSRYSFYDTINSSKIGNTMKKSYTWNNCPEFTLKSVNLCHKNNSHATWTLMNYTQNGTAAVIKRIGAYYFWSRLTGTSTYSRKGLTYNQLGKKSTWTWEAQYGRPSWQAIQVGAKSFASSDSQVIMDQIIPLKNNEIALLKYDDDNSDYANAGSNTSRYYVRYVRIIDATTGEKKRSFPITQFSGWTSGAATGTIQSTRIRLFATDFGNFIMMPTQNGSPYNNAIWRIPDQSEMENYSNNEAIPVWSDLTDNYFKTILADQGSIILINNFLIYGNETTKKTLRINSATPGDITMFDYIPFNGAASIGRDSNYKLWGWNLNKNYSVVFGNYTDAIEIWYNTTALNLSGGGVSIAAGDTLTIEYTITAN